MRAEPIPRPPWWAHPVFRQQEAEIEELRAEVERLRALLKPPAYAFPAKWRLSPQQGAFLSMLYAQAGCVSHGRLAAGLVGRKGPASRLQLGVTASHIRRKVNRYGVEIEAYFGAGYGLTVEGRAMVRIAVEAMVRMRGA